MSTPHLLARRTARLRGGTVAAFVVTFALVFAPVAITISSAFGLLVPSGDPGPKGLSNFRSVLGSESFTRELGYTVLLAAVGVAVAVALGVTLAIVMIRTNTPGVRVGILRWTPTLAFLLPSVLVFLAWQVLYERRVGLFNQFLRWVTSSDARLGPIDLRTLPMLMLAVAVFLVPVVYASVVGAITSISTEGEQAAQTCGARWPTVLRRVTIPSVIPAIGAAALLAFVLGLSTYVVPATIRISGVRTLSIRMREAMDGTGSGYGRASVVALVLVVMCSLALIARQRWVSGTEASLQLRTPAASKYRLEIGWARPIGVIIFVTFTVFGVLLPVAGVVNLSFRRFWNVGFERESFTLDNFRLLTSDYTYADLGAALRNSIVVAIVTATIGVILSIWLARVIVRSGRRGRILELLTFVPAGIPPIMTGLALLIVTLRVFPSMYATPVPVVIALTVTVMPFSVQLILAGLRRVPREVEAAAAVAGAGPWRRFTSVVLPLILPEVSTAWVLTALVSIRDVDAVVMLNTSQYPLVGPVMLDLWTQGEATAASALGLVMLGATIALAFLAFACLFAYRTIARLWVRSALVMPSHRPRMRFAHRG
jgi:iron(III) transport system permease protein